MSAIMMTQSSFPTYMAIKASKLNAKPNPTTPRFRLYYIKSQEATFTKSKTLDVLLHLLDVHNFSML